MIPKKPFITHSISLTQKHGQKLVALLAWIVVALLFLGYKTINGYSFKELFLQFGTVLTTPLGPFLFILIYTLRPILFFPASILTIAGGAIFGPIGVLWVVVGSNLSALVAYGIGRFFGSGLIDETAEGVILRYAQRMRQNGFITILIMRFIYLPYDLVNYFSGILKIDWRKFIVATALGSIPGTAFYTLFGASFQNLDQALSGQLPKLNPIILAISLTMFVVSLLLSWYFKKIERKSNRQLQGKR